MKIKTLRPIRLDHGAVKAGTVIDVPDVLARFFLSRGEAEMHVPFVQAGPVELSSASPVAQVSAETTLSESEPGAKKRGRKKSVQSS